MYSSRAVEARSGKKRKEGMKLNLLPKLVEKGKRG